MSDFLKENFIFSGGLVQYRHDGIIRFCARFKYGAATSAKPFATFLIRNFTVEEYFEQREGGKSPLEIVEARYGSGSTSAGTRREDLEWMHGKTGEVNADDQRRHPGMAAARQEPQ